jgi:glycosyltransferase involved in cell wall biosynthesis
MKKIFILVPSPHPAGPIKGAYALANALAKERVVTLVTLKLGPGVSAPLDSRVVQFSLSDAKGMSWKRWVRAYQAMLEAAGGRERVASISLCFSADMVNFCCGRQAVICSSVRANMLQNYHMDYGLIGIPLAVAHLTALGRFDHVVAMTEAMSDQVKRYARKIPEVIGNFVDEEALEPYRVQLKPGKSLRFVFIGSLTSRKQPLLLISAVKKLVLVGMNICLDIIGDGPLRHEIEVEVARLLLNKVIRLHGHLSEPYHLLAEADAMVLPSLSEGVARAALEALYLGVPCVMREADGNGELIFTGYNGTLFRRDEELAEAMLSAARIGRHETNRVSLLPKAFRQYDAAKRYLELIEQK